MNLNIRDVYNKQLPVDLIKTNAVRQVYEACFSTVLPQIPSKPKVLHVSKEVAALLGLNEEDLQSELFLKVVTGAQVLENTHPYAMCYGGHQFGHWAGQLGDGRAINLAEVEHDGQLWAVQLKGAGKTPYSRTADGLAVLRSSIREYLCSEAMHHLGVPTTRALSLSLSGDQVMRDVLYDGHPAYEKGAIVCRVAPSFIRFGNFELFAKRGDFQTLQVLTDLTLSEFFPDREVGTKNGYLSFFKEVVDKSLEMVVHWQRVGFVHGVMNTDNMSILGLTIDYGPYGWLEGYDPDWTPNTTDRQNRRYRFRNQPQIVLWNLYQLANALLPLIEDPAPLEAILNQFTTNFDDQYLTMMRSKLGLDKKEAADSRLVADLEKTLQLTETDMTIFFRQLADVHTAMVFDGENGFVELIQDAFYAPEDLSGQVLAEWLSWFERYQLRLKAEESDTSIRKMAMNQVNPKYVLRNYMAQMAIDEADQGNYTLLEQLTSLLKNPYSEQEENQKWFAKRPEWARTKVGCSMLSCSS